MAETFPKETVVGTSKLTSPPRIIERAKLAFVKGLREAFSSSIADPRLRYSEDKDVTKLKIFTAHPLVPEFFPSIVVSTAGGDASFRYLADDFTDTRVEDNELVYAGRVVLTISLTVLSNSTLEREKVMDHLIIFIRHLFRDRLHGFGLEYTRDIRIGPETLTEVENKPVYEQTMDIPCYMEFDARVDQRALDEIRSVCVILDEDESG